MRLSQLNSLSDFDHFSLSLGKKVEKPAPLKPGLKKVHEGRDHLFEDSKGKLHYCPPVPNHLGTTGGASSSKTTFQDVVDLLNSMANIYDGMLEVDRSFLRVDGSFVKQESSVKQESLAKPAGSANKIQLPEPTAWPFSNSKPSKPKLHPAAAWPFATSEEKKPEPLDQILINLVDNEELNKVFKKDDIVELISIIPGEPIAIGDRFVVKFIEHDEIYVEPLNGGTGTAILLYPEEVKKVEVFPYPEEVKKV